MREQIRAASIGTKSNVAADSAASVSLLAANEARVGATFYNDSTSACYLDLSGGTASSTSFSHKMDAGGMYELPYAYRGAITARWVATNGNMRITEFV